MERISELGTTLAVTSNRSTANVTANVVSRSTILTTLMMEVTRSSRTSVLTGAARRHIPDEGILQVP
jgi:hypothetical protein